MGTRSMIVKLDDEFNGRMIYCSHDSHLHHLGAVLHNQYQDATKIDALLDLGAVEMVGASLDSPPADYFTVEGMQKYDRKGGYTIAWGRDRGMTDREDFKPERTGGMAHINALAEESHVAFFYVFDAENGWRVRPRGTEIWTRLRDIPDQLIENN